MRSIAFRFRCTIWLLAALLLMPVLCVSAAGTESAGVPLVVNGRTVHVFRVALGDFSAEERANTARGHIRQALEARGEGWTSIAPAENGIIVRLDGVPMFTVVAGDAQSGESAETLANQASRALQKVWAESRENRGDTVNAVAVLKVVAAFLVLALGLALLGRLSRLLRRFTTSLVAGHINRLADTGIAPQISGMVLRLVARLCVIVVWLSGLLAIFFFLTFALAQFVFTRPVSESLSHSLTAALSRGLLSAADAIPGLFVAVLIFLLARIATQISRMLFDGIAAGSVQMGALDAHTAPATRQLVNAAIWLFALAMAYPYLPGSHTEAFKGLSVLLGVMVSIGASGLVGQIASGMILVFTRALLIGEYVRIQECEGTVIELGLCVTRLRTGTGEEISLPNSLVISHVTRNFSRNVERGGFVLDTEVTIGYDTPWRQVHAMLLEAAARIPGVRSEPAPFVVQTALSDFYVVYRLVVNIGAESSAVRPRVLSDLNAAIQDVFNHYGVQIMSPHYLADPPTAKLVPESEWRKPPAAGNTKPAS